MPKVPRRKPPKRKAEKPKLDEDLSALAGVLDEYRLDNNAHGWFRIPWRNGWNAVGLAWSIWAKKLLDLANSTESEKNASDFIEELLVEYEISLNSPNYALVEVYPDKYSLIKNPTFNPPIDEVYWNAQDHIVAISNRTFVTQSLLFTSLRCLQVMISKSSGGGEVYNDLLINAFKHLTLDEIIENFVLEYRCRDALNTTSHLQGDKHDRVRKAFAIAWRRGLYMSAYALPPVVKIGDSNG